MNFDNIEGLSENDLLNLYFNIIQEDYLIATNCCSRGYNNTYGRPCQFYHGAACAPSYNIPEYRAWNDAHCRGGRWNEGTCTFYSASTIYCETNWGKR